MPRAFIVAAFLALVLAAPSFAAEKVSKAIAELQEKAGNGDVQAEYKLGEAYYRGADVALDYKKAMEWLMKAAQEDHAGAQVLVGNMYYNGYGVKADKEETAKWYLKAAEQGNLLAETNIAYLYRAGWGVKKDFVKSYMWYSVAVTAGDQYSNDEIGQLSGVMMPNQISEARRLADKWRPHPSKATLRDMRENGNLSASKPSE